MTYLDLLDAPGGAHSPALTGTLAVRPRKDSSGNGNPDHHLWNNRGTWWCRFTLHRSDHTAERVRVSLKTRDVTEARRRRDLVLRTLSDAVPSAGREPRGGSSDFSMGEEFTIDITPNFAAAWQRVETYWPERAITLRALKWVLSDRTDFAAVSQTQLLINPTGLLGPYFEGSEDPVGHIAFLLVHEAGHIENQDHSNYAGTNNDIANQASDYIVNGEISRMNAVLKGRHGVDLFPLPPWVLFDPFLSSGKWSAIDVYQVLFNAELDSDAENKSK